MTRHSQTRHSRLRIVAGLLLVTACQADDHLPVRPDARQDSVASAPDTLAAWQVLSPAPGEVLREGARYTIRWTSKRPGEVNVSVAVGGKDRGHLAMRLPVGNDSLEWRVPLGFISGFGPRRSDAVRIRIEDAADPSVGTTSEPFTIVADSAG